MTIDGAFPTIDLQDSQRFLGRLPFDGQFLEIRVVVPDAHCAQQFFCTTVADAIEVIEARNGRANVYVGACPRSQRSGTREDVSIVLAVWADLDFHQIDPVDRERAERVARERLSQFPFPPTVVVFTGNGIQAWWFFHSPIRISDDCAPERFEAINRGIAKVLGGDAVHDLARVLRVPGTTNLPDAKKRARGCVPVVARLLLADGPTYSPEDFRDLEVQESKTTRPQEVPHSAVTAPQPDSEILEAFANRLRELGSWHPLSRTWRGDRFLNDSSRSGFDMALVNQLVRARVRDEFIPTIVRAYPFGRGVFASDGYIARTLAKAKASKGARHGAA
jgi:hypothetical protein